jgi:single-stranded-DNA-specific exonuclease
MKKEWVLNKDKINHCAPLVERLLTIRGIKDQKAVKEFLNPCETTLLHPNAFIDIPKATERLIKAIENQENILIYGDFDADGVTATSLLLKTFKTLGAKVDYFIPDREKEGHGLHLKTLVKLMASKKPKVIVTVDCATSDVEQVKFINSFKIDIIITDHHEAPEILPSAFAIINPKAQNALDEKLSAKEIMHLTSLAGVGVAFKLAQSLLEKYNKLDFIPNLLPYVAVGTISDLVPLTGENRYFVSKGLQLISDEKHWGIKRILESAGYNLENGITSEQIAFGVAPRINASGRLDTVEDALKVLTSDNRQEIEMSIISLNNFNKIRQELCESTFLEAEEMLKNQGCNDNAIVLYNPEWHVGIVGIVASKLVEKYYKPAFLMTYSEETQQIRCSARSVEGISIYDVLSANAELFDGFGGHAMAGGLSFSRERIEFNEVKKALNSTINELINGKEISPVLKVDLVLEPDDINENLISDIERLQPFGEANPNPVFVLNNLTLVQKKLMGSNKNHLKLIVQDIQNNTYDCIWWSKGDISLISGDVLDIAFCPKINIFNGKTTIQLILQDIHAANLIEEELSAFQKKSEIKIYDHRKKTNIFSSVEDYVKTSNLKIAVFAEEKEIIENLKHYKALSERSFNRQNIEKSDSIIFFDYPASKEIFDEILKKSSPEFLHFMNYESKNINEKEFLKTFLGMLKFSYNKQNGSFNIERCASFLAQTEEIVLRLLNIFAEIGMIKFKEKNIKEYQIELLSDSQISKALHTQSYKEFINQVKVVFNYKKSFLESELNFLI